MAQWRDPISQARPESGQSPKDGFLAMRRGAVRRRGPSPAGGGAKTRRTNGRVGAIEAAPLAPDALAAALIRGGQAQQHRGQQHGGAGGGGWLGGG